MLKNERKFNYMVGLARKINDLGKSWKHYLIPHCGDFCRSRSGTERDLTISQNGLCLWVYGFVECLWLYDYWSTQKNAVF